MLITDKLKSYAAANKDIGLKFEHRQHKGLNNQCKISAAPPAAQIYFGADNSKSCVECQAPSVVLATSTFPASLKTWLTPMMTIGTMSAI